jgi:predicted PurR-regulated permease PerM
MTPKRPTNGFTSLRILSKRAQSYLRSARAAAPEEKRPGQRKVNLPPVVRIPLSNVLGIVLIILAVAVAAWLLWVLKDKIILLLLAFFVASIIDPGVRRLERWGVPRGLAIIIHYAVVFFLLLFLVFSLTPIIAEQISDLSRFAAARADAFLADPQVSIPFIPVEINDRLTSLVRGSLQQFSVGGYAAALERWGQNLSGLAQGSFLFATRVAGGVLTFFISCIVVLVLAFFIQIEKENIRRWVRGFLPAHSRNYLDSKVEAVQAKIGQWARGQLILGLVVGSLVFIALTILGMPYALTLAALAAFTEFIPYVGPFIAAVPAVLIALTEGGFLWAVVVAAVYYVVQWCENNLLVPLIMKRAVGLSPIAIIFAMLVGVSFPEVIHPILGILLAIPVTTIIAVFLNDMRDGGD